MTTQLLDRPETASPSENDSRLAVAASREIARAAPGAVRLSIGGDTLDLPQAATQLLSHILLEMGRGNAVTVLPLHAELTTQQAADLLNVSRPHLVSLLERGALAFHMAGSHRRIRFSDLCAYRQKAEHEREAAMTELAAQAQEFKLGY